MIIPLFHFHATQVKRSAGQSVVAAAAYRAGEKLYSDYYGEVADYTRKGGVVCSEILLSAHAPPEYADRQTLWNAVEKVERGKKAQLAYSFDIALQNEFTLEENVALARQFLLENFVSKGMIVDFAVHAPEKDGIPNPHFHVLSPIRPLKENGEWGAKQHREYLLDEHGNRIPDGKGGFVFNAVPTTDWGKPETLEEWRKAWAELCNARFAEKNLECHIDHRSYERQAIEQIPTIHEGPAVRQMEKRGIQTEKGNLNRWIRKANEMLRELKGKVIGLIDWATEVKSEITKLQAPTLADYLALYYDKRNAGAYSNKAKSNNLKDYAATVNFLSGLGLSTLNSFETYLDAKNAEIDALISAMKGNDQALLKGQRKYTVPLGTDPLGNIIRLDNSLNNFPERINSAENELDTLHQQQAAAQIEVEKPFPQEEELAEKSARLAELNAQLDVDEKSHEPEQDEEEQEDAPRRPSVLAALEDKADKVEPVKPFKSYFDKEER